jgi:hypothetical protein
MYTYKYKLTTLPLNYDSIKELLESDCGMTNNRYDRDPWDAFYGIDNSEESNEIQPTENSSVTKYDPKHYQRGRIQVWDFIVDQQLDFLAGNVIKYICRAGHKDQESELDDWLKVKAYVDRKIKALSTDGNS